MAFRLSPDAADKHARLSALLAELSLSADQAHALLLAPDLAEDASDPDFANEDGSAPDLEFILEVWGEGSHEAWRDVLCEIPAFLTAD